MSQATSFARLYRSLQTTRSKHFLLESRQHNGLLHSAAIPDTFFPCHCSAFCESAGLNARLQNNIQQFFQVSCCWWDQSACGSAVRSNEAFIRMTGSVLLRPPLLHSCSQAEYTCPSSDQARVRASCAQRSSGFAEDNLPAPYMSKGRSSMNDENWQQIVRRFPNVANMVHELHCRVSWMKGAGGLISCATREAFSSGWWLSLLVVWCKGQAIARH